MTGYRYWTLAMTLVRRDIRELGKSVMQAISVYLVVFLLYRVARRALFSPLRKLPGPWYTNITGVVRKYYAWKHKEHIYYMKMLDKYGPLVRTGPDRVGVGEVGAFKKMMASHSLPKTSMYSDFAVVGENIFTTRNPELNKTRRRQLGPSFTATAVRHMEVFVMEDGIRRLCALFDAQIDAAHKSQSQATIINVYFSLVMMSTDIISSLGFGKRFGAIDLLRAMVLGQSSVAPDADDKADVDDVLLPADKIMQYTTQTMELMVKVAEMPILNHAPPCMMSAELRNLCNSRDMFMHFAESTVAKRRAELAEGNVGVDRKDMLTQYIKAKDPFTGKMLTDREIGSESTVLIAAGTDTTTNTMTHCVRLLLKYPETYKRLADDIRHQFKSPEEVAYDKVRQSLPYLQAVIYETMRMRAATNGVWPRDAPPEGIVLHGYYIPHGVTLCGSIGGVHMNPETWDEPTRFDPERFMGPEGEARKRLVVAFSTGARICPGRHLAMMSMMLTLTHLLLRYDFAALSQPDMHVSYYDEVDDQCRITTGHSRPERDCNVIIAKRF